MFVYLCFDQLQSDTKAYLLKSSYADLLIKKLAIVFASSSSMCIFFHVKENEMMFFH